MISIQRFRADVEFPSDDGVDLVPIALAQVVSLWERVTCRKWAREVGRVDVIEPKGARPSGIQLRLWPVETITKVEVACDMAGTGGWTELLAADGGWVLAAPRTLVRIARYWEPAVRVTYTAGYADDAAPADVLAALTTQAKFMRVRMSTSLLGTRSQNFEGGAGVFEKADLHPFFEAQAKRYRRR